MMMGYLYYPSKRFLLKGIFDGNYVCWIPESLHT